MNFRIFFLLISFWFVSSAQAVNVKGLYSAEINLPVTQSEAQMLNKAFALAAEQVLIKVSGNKEAISGDLLLQAQQQASSWVAQHSVASLNELLPSDGGLVPGKQIRVTFYQESIDSFLSQNALPVWGNNRPSVLVWLASENNGIRRLSGSNAPSQILNDFALASSRVGVPIYAPLIDATDLQSITAADVWGFFEDSIADASKRYQTDAVAALRVSSYAGHIGGSLLVMQKAGETERFTLTGDTLEALLDQASAKLAYVFASRYASVRNAGSASVLTMQIGGVNNYASMAKVQAYLESIGVVREVTLVQVKEEQVEYRIAVDGDKQKLFNSISLSSLLVETPLNALDPDANRVVSYLYSGVN
ncbi:DUF2066 domain-containing protein [Marinomonas sp. THO17]|uniref:DUF2066 domain-containing protein n=1 Tax=Marinomonas sp. THO17 TaxID=3149048 RepID=UPI00336BCFF8